MNSLNRDKHLTRTIVKIMLPLFLIMGGAAGFFYFKSQKVVIKRKPPASHVSVVQTLTLFPGLHRTKVFAMGTVKPDQEIQLKARVAGEVVYLSDKFVQGGLMEKGEVLVRLEDLDYQLAADKAKSSLDKALADLEIEKGQQYIAKEELKLISQVSPGGVTSTDLALRKPQLIQARAAVASARAELEKAQLDLGRTQIILPFDALVLEKNVDLGSLLQAQGEIATLVGINKYQVQAQVDLTRLSLLTIDETLGSPARIRSLYADHVWNGRVVRTTGKITGQSRMAGVIVEILDPLGLESKNAGPRLLIDDHVEAVITGRSLDHVYALPRSLIRENNTLWIYDSGRLKIVAARPVWKEKDRVFIRSGISPGDRVIVSDLSVPVQGMALTLAPGEKP
ncbi:MAG: efflux RND transporter periplasmic adaptor subunit [Desulfobacter sp.]|nr:efflux RND transporter periplasmic adaptor subunit [Desulfobacter sp.]WDP84605.1 MAG: efflux RND transporter periplasmic adaptor subunit [Desulfobacter sp.]